MLPYQLRKRALVVLDTGKTLKFPNVGQVEFTLTPGGAFGAGPLSDYTLLKDVYVELIPDGDTAKYRKRSPQYLEPMSLDAVTGGMVMQMRGNIVTVKRLFTSQNDLELLIDSLTFRIPIALTLHFREAPIISNIKGNINGVRFESPYQEYPLTVEVITQETQERQFLKSWEGLELLVPAENIRLYAALNYFHTACRLAYVGFTAWEFMGEALLNLCKVLEILFPSTRDAAREGLRRLGYTKEEREHRFLSVMALRSELDVAHVSLVALEKSELECLHRYTNKAEEYFREMLSRVIDRVAAGELSLPSYTPGTGHKEVLRRLCESFPPG